MKISIPFPTRAAVVVAAALLFPAGPGQAQVGRNLQKCLGGVLKEPGSAGGGENGDELVVDVACKVGAGTYRFGNVNVIAGGTLEFVEGKDARIEFWARSILVESKGALLAGTTKPFGSDGGVLTIHLYGADQGALPFTQRPSPGKGIRCLGENRQTCGVPLPLWKSNLVMGSHELVKPADGKRIVDVPAVDKVWSLADYPGWTEKKTLENDYFYPYHPLPYDDADPMGFFGYKVLAVSYGGTLKLSGKKGACTTGCDDPSTTGQSWLRLAAELDPAAKELTVAGPVDWKAGDHLVVTTTDYLPGHSEELVLLADTNGGTRVTLNVDPANGGLPVKYHHNGTVFPLNGIGVLGQKLQNDGAETRAAVGLLSRSIRIVSEGSRLDDPLPEPPASTSIEERPDSYFGGHMIARQGFKSLQVQGVEFYQMGQGGRMAHYPIHFHHARRTPKDTFVKDCSIRDSMTRWIVLHGTHDVTIARNVGYKSIGHGFYLEDGTEINNAFLGNLGVLARAAVMKSDGTAQRDNPRKVPGILALADRNPVSGRSQAVERIPFRSDYDHPSLFWIMNGWNDFQYNMAAGASGCGVAYWLVPGYNSGMSRGLRWTSYASMQNGIDRAAMTPLKSFVGNGAVSAQTSFQTIGATTPCFGIGNPDPLNADQSEVTPYLEPVLNRLAPTWPTGDPKDPAVAAAREALLDYFPGVDTGGGRFATRCGTGSDEKDCSTRPVRCSSGNDSETDCMVTVLDRYTTSFHWAEFNFAAVWLRPQWYLVTDSVFSDVQGGGLNFVTGGGYSASDRINGHWALVQRSAFIGQTQPDTSVFALDGGPFNPGAGALHCAGTRDRNGFAMLPGNYCLSVDEGVSFPISNFGMSQRLFSVYDGPAFQDSNAYLRIRTRRLEDCKLFHDTTNFAGRCDADEWTDSYGMKRNQSAWLAGSVQGLPKKEETVGKKTVEAAYMPNAAIGWKQPNGFYYPPAFHSSNLYFGGDVEIRHFVLEPVFQLVTQDQPRLFVTDPKSREVTDRYAVYNSGLFTGFTDIDRQTVLNDDDGSLTGYKETISVNLDDFFAGPKEVIECRSNASAKTSPFQHVTTVIYPGCAVDGSCSKTYKDPPVPNPHDGEWDRPCSGPTCYGVPLYRLHLTAGDAGVPKSIFMMGQSIGQRNSLTVNNGTYYVDTTRSRETQEKAVCPPNNDCNISVFRKDQTYYLFLVFGKKSTKQTYQIYVGKSATYDEKTAVWMTQADIRFDPIAFKDYTGATDWPARWVRKYDADKGILTVTLDLSDAPGFTRKIAAAREANCRPFTYCAWNPDGVPSGAVPGEDTGYEKGTCVEKGTTSDTVCRWGGKDMDCPEGGCFGIGFKMAPGFTTGGGPDPAAGSFCADRTDAGWSASLVPVADGTCPPEGEVPSDGFCDGK